MLPNETTMAPLTQWLPGLKNGQPIQSLLFNRSMHTDRRLPLTWLCRRARTPYRPVSKACGFVLTFAPPTGLIFECMATVSWLTT